MLFLRKIFFYLFVVVYVIFCPLMVLYALGYIFKSGAEQGIVKTGLIYFSTAPPGASVYLGNRRYTKRTPTILPGLLPGQYPVKLVLKKHRTWNTDLPVEAGKATVLERVLLLPEVWTHRELTSLSFENLIPLAGTRFFLLSRGSKAGELFLFDWREEKIWPLFPRGSSFQDSEVLSLIHMKESPAFLLHADSEGGRRFFWMVPRGKENPMKDLTDLFPEPPAYLEWDPEDRRHLFSFQAGSLNRLDTVSLTITPKFLNQVRGFGVEDRKIYVLRDDLIFEQVDFEGERAKVLLDDPILGRSLFGEEGFYQIKIFSDNLIIFLSSRGRLLANRLPYHFVDEGIQGLGFDAKSKRLLIWKRAALGIVDFSREREEIGSFEEGPSLVWVYKRGEEIDQAFWVYDGSHILFRDEDQVFLLELETHGKPHLYEVLRVKEKSSIFYSEDSGFIYYLEAETGKLQALELLPKRQILLLPFPERKEEEKKSEIGELP